MKASPCALLLAGLAVTAAAASPAGALPFTVINTSDSGAGSLREAVTLANGNPGPDDIRFAIPGPGVHTIQLLSPLGISEAVVIDGYTQPGASPNTLATGNDAVLLIELDGTAAGPAAGGLINIDGGGSTVRGLVINRAGGGNSGIRTNVNNGNVIAGNFIGTDPTGMIDLGNASHGVLIAGGNNHRVGGPSPADRNVISGNTQSGVRISSSTGNLVQGNFIGVNAAGTAAIGNAVDGVQIGVAAGNTVGGTSAGAGNVISGNGGRGIRISDAGSAGNVIQGNFIGTDATGTLDLGNGMEGVALINNAQGNTIGGPTALARNVISGNGGDGIEIHGFGAGAANANIVRGNFIGVDAGGLLNLGNNGFGIALVTFVTNSSIGGTASGEGNVIRFNGLGGIAASGADSTGNSIRGNSIFANAGLGIDLLGTAGVTPNDALDADTGPNQLQNFPILVTASSGGGSTNVQGTLHGAPNMAFAIDIFSSPVCDESGNGEGSVYLGSTTANTDGSGNGSFNATLPVSVAPQHRITATATDPAGNTSEFSACLSLAARFHTVTPCRVADTRDPDGPYGGPALAANTNRDFVIIGRCGVPATAQAVSFNFVVVSPTALGDVRVFPAGGSFPLVSTMNYRPEQIRANNAIVPLGPAGGITVRCVQADGTAHFIIDINGYFE